MREVRGMEGREGSGRTRGDLGIRAFLHFAIGRSCDEVKVGGLIERIGG